MRQENTCLTFRLLEWGGQMICITQLTIHDFMNKQKISTSNS